MHSSGVDRAEANSSTLRCRTRNNRQGQDARYRNRAECGMGPDQQPNAGDNRCTAGGRRPPLQHAENSKYSRLQQLLFYYLHLLV